MIPLDFSLTVLVYTLIPVSFIVMFFLFFGHSQEIDIGSLDKVFIQECSVCLHIYKTRRKKPFFQCPMCGSYNQMIPKPTEHSKSNLSINSSLHSDHGQVT